MTVAELLESLRHYPKEALVVIEGPDHSYLSVRDWPAIATRNGRGHLSEDDERQSDADVRERGERRVPVVVFR